MRRLLLALAIALSSLVQTTYAQTDLPQQMSFNYGKSVVDELLPEGFAYNPITLLANTPLYSFGAFSLYAETQFTRAENLLTRSSEFEFGLNGGIRYQVNLNKYFELNAAIGSGPHFISLETRLQATGFIFSDNFELGFSFYLPAAKTSFNVKGRFRHISNAGLKSPNWGIDNLFLIVGIGTVL
ncbi:MAG: acyloxyacyl hydrolase [Saprospiraceae bacterium]|nr:acyloxyacyl hydrolase [Saprospiraceae bacterium]